MWYYTNKGCWEKILKYIFILRHYRRERPYIRCSGERRHLKQLRIQALHHDQWDPSQNWTYHHPGGPQHTHHLQVSQDRQETSPDEEIFSAASSQCGSFIIFDWKLGCDAESWGEVEHRIKSIKYILWMRVFQPLSNRWMTIQHNLNNESFYFASKVGDKLVNHWSSYKNCWFLNTFMIHWKSHYDSINIFGGRKTSEEHSIHIWIEPM